MPVKQEGCDGSSPVTLGVIAVFCCNLVDHRSSDLSHHRTWGALSVAGGSYQVGRGRLVPSGAQDSAQRVRDVSVTTGIVLCNGLSSRWGSGEQ